jgi:DNA topoisomerase-1
MAYSLMIVESVAKGKTIEKYLNSAAELKENGPFKVMACLGHIVDMPSKKLSVDTTTWQVDYQPIPTKKEVIQRLRTAIKDARKIYVASDLDLEGEALGEHLVQYFKIPKTKYVRITFSEITKSALVQAILNPRDFDMNRVYAQETRRILDRVVGYEASPLLWRRFATGNLSAGRVQSATLKMVVQRQKEIEQHQPESYWTVQGEFTGTGTTILTSAYEGSKKKHWGQPDLCKAFLKKCFTLEPSWNASIAWKESLSNPSAPFTTSTFQQEVYQRYKIPIKQTMRLAQDLYEAGYITYMRTDSTNLSQEFKSQVHQYITETLGGTYVKSRIYKTKTANAQEAHEAIRPSHIEVKSSQLEGDKITPSHVKVYDLIWRRTVASQMIPATYQEMTWTIGSTPELIGESQVILFKGTTSLLVEPGYLRIYQPDVVVQRELYEELKTKYTKAIQVQLKELEAKGDLTRPPPHYQESSLVKTLEKVGMGRPSTYATILDKLFERNYIQKMSPTPSVHPICHFKASSATVTEEEATLTLHSSEKDCMIPTSLGIRICEYLEETVPDILNVEFTSQMESKLDAISQGHHQKEETLNQFYKDFHSYVERAEEKSDVMKKDGSKKVDKTMLRPKNVSGTYEVDQETYQVVQTRYGPALFHESSKRFISVSPFLVWRKMELEALTQQDVRFLVRLPQKLPNSEYELQLGRYGMYLIKDGKNLPLDKEQWEDAYQGTLDGSKVIIPAFTKKPYPKKKASAK